MEKCFKCHIDENHVRLFDGIFEGKVVSVCERCSIIDNIPIIKKPSVNQLKDSEKNISVYERMKRIAGIKDEKKEEKINIKEKLKELEKDPLKEAPEIKKLNLIDHYDWEITRIRRKKGYSQKQLAEAIGESELIIDLIEKGYLPENSENVIKKIEQFFNINLRKVSELDLILKSKEKKPVLLDKYGNPLDKIPEPKIEKKEEISKEDNNLTLQILSKNEISKENKKIEETKEEKSIKKENKILSILKRLKKEEKENKDETKEKLDLEKDFLENKKEISEELLKKENLKEEEIGEDIDLSKLDWEKTKIADLIRLHQKKIESDKKKELEEKQKKEERQKLIEKIKEEQRIKKEKEKEELNNILGGIELLDLKEKNKNLNDKF